MNSALLATLLAAPELPELIEEAQRALLLEQSLRQKFYNDITPKHKWEFIQGEVIMHSPALNRHLVASQHVYDLLSAYVRVKGLGLVRHEKAMTTFPRNDYEPDVMFFGMAKAALISPDTLKFPIPDLIVEVISPSTEKRDRGIKFQDYSAHGVAEYWIIDTVAESIELYHLSGETYVQADKLTEGLFSSQVIPGLTIPVKAIFNEVENAKVMRQIWLSET